MEANLTPCTVCGHEISTAAASCPKCGHPLGGGVGSEVEHIQKVGDVVTLLLNIPVYGLQATLLKLVGVSNAAATDATTPEITIASVFTQTAPFSIAVAIIVLALIQDKSFREFQGFVGLLAAVLLGSVFLNYWLTDIGGPSGMANPFAIVYNVLVFYWNLYGPSLFISAAIVGGYSAYSINKIWPK